jgi:hypothetical protein
MDLQRIEEIAAAEYRAHMQQPTNPTGRVLFGFSSVKVVIDFRLYFIFHLFDHPVYEL